MSLRGTAARGAEGGCAARATSSDRPALPILRLRPARADTSLTMRRRPGWNVTTGREQKSQDDGKLEKDDK